LGALDQTASTVPSIVGTDVALTTIDVPHGGNAAIVKVKICVPVPPPFVAFTVSTNVPDAVGVPVIVEPEKINPPGNTPVTA